MKSITIPILLLCPFLAFAQISFLQISNENELNLDKTERMIFPTSYQTLQFNKSNFDLLRGTTKSNPAIIELPMPDGSIQQFEIFESSILGPKAQAEFPDHTAFAGWGLDDPSAYIRMGWTSLGFHAMILTKGGALFIDPYHQQTQDYYISYTKKAYAENYFQEFEPYHCGVGELEVSEIDPDQLEQASEEKATGDQLRTFRIAVAGTEDYTTAIGNQTDAYSAIETSILRVSAVFEIEFAFQLEFSQWYKFGLYYQWGTLFCGR